MMIKDKEEIMMSFLAACGLSVSFSFLFVPFPRWMTINIKARKWGICASFVRFCLFFIYRVDESIGGKKANQRLAHF